MPVTKKIGNDNLREDQRTTSIKTACPRVAITSKLSGFLFVLGISVLLAYPVYRVVLEIWCLLYGLFIAK